MNENLNLIEILKDCPNGTKLYSPIYGDVELVCVLQNIGIEYPIQTKISDDAIDSFTNDGRMFAEYKGECMLFPSREERNWSNFNHKKQKFDPKSLQSFDKVLVRNHSERWRVQSFSNIIEDNEDYRYFCINNVYRYCIPYNDDTKHLVGTTEEAPEFYRYW